MEVVKKKKYSMDNIFFYIIMLILFATYLFGDFSLAIIVSLLFWVFIIVSPITEGYALCFFAYPLSGIFDGFGFSHFFNIAVIVFTIKLVFISVLRKKMSGNILLNSILVVFLALYDICNATLNNLFFLSYISNFSIWIIMLFLVVSSKWILEIDLKKIYKRFFEGFIFSAILCVISVMNTWGGINSVPTAYRFTGMLRDPNYYALCGIVLAFSTLNLVAGYKKTILFIILTMTTLLSISKMSILLLLGGILLYILFPVFSTKKIVKYKKFTYTFLVLIVTGIAFVITLDSGIFDWFFDKFSFRLTSNTLTTGRDYLQQVYMDYFLSDPLTFIFGKSLNYNYFYDVSYSVYKNMLAHNTYIDILMSFGLIGSSIYIFTMFFCIKQYRYLKIGQKGYDKIILPFIFLLSLFALSYLKTDGFIVIIVYLCFVTFKPNIECE